MESRRVRVGVQIGQYGASWQALRSAALQAEEIGLDAIFNWDHFFGPGSDSSASHLECWTMLAAWAEATDQISIGSLVSAIGYRNPDLLADMARAVDHICDGRLILGLGAGFKERDYVEYGYEFPPIGRRITELEQGIERIRDRFERLNPRPNAGIPLLIGGSGEQRTLRIVAQAADIWHTFADGEDFARKSRLLDTYCTDIGRDPQQIERSVLVAGDPAELGDDLLAAGARLFIVRIDTRPHIDLTPATRWLRWRDSANASSATR